MTRATSCFVVFAAAVVFSLAGPAQAGAPFPLPQGMVDVGSLQAWGSLGDGSYSIARGLNDLGQVVGDTAVIIPELPDRSTKHPFVWTQAGGMQDLGAPPGSTVGDWFAAFGINNAGEILVNRSLSYNNDLWDQAWKYTSGAAQPWLQLAPSGEGRGTKANAINQNGIAAGAADSPTVENPDYWVWQACKWSAGGAIVNLGRLPGTHGAYQESEARAIDDAGVVAGYSRNSFQIMHAVVWDAAGVITEIGNLLEPDPANPKVYSIATGINNHGVVCGYYWGPADFYPGYNGTEHAFMWSQAGGMVKLGPMSPDLWSRATGINDNGQITGSGGSPWYFGPVNHAFRWQDGVYHDLGPLGDRYADRGYATEYSLGRAINQFGQVVGDSQSHSPDRNYANPHGFFIDPKWSAPGLLAFYPFDGNAQDVSGHGYHGQVFGATLTAGYRGQAYSFNGVDNYIKVKLDIAPSQQWNITMGAWVKAKALEGGS